MISYFFDTYSKKQYVLYFYEKGHGIASIAFLELASLYERALLLSIGCKTGEIQHIGFDTKGNASGLFLSSEYKNRMCYEK